MSAHTNVDRTTIAEQPNSPDRGARGSTAAGPDHASGPDRDWVHAIAHYVHAIAYAALLAEVLAHDPKMVDRAARHIERHLDAPGYAAAAVLLRQHLRAYEEGGR